MTTAARPANRPARSLARLAGLFQLSEALTSGFGQVIVPAMIVVPADAAATARNIVAHELMFRLCLVLVLGAVVSHTIWTFLFYRLFKPVDQNVSLLAAYVSLVAIAVQASSGLVQFAPIIVLRGSSAAFTTGQLQALSLMLVKLSAQAFYVYLALFGLWCVLIGSLIFRSTFMPRTIGVLEMLAGVCWLAFVWPPLAHRAFPYNQALAAIGELSLMLWLLAIGVDERRWAAQSADVEACGGS